MRQRAAEARAAGRKPGRSQAWVPLSRISRNLVEAVVSAEDGKFFGHQGVDWEALKESAQKDWEKRRFVRGGSTITQQLAKNLYFTTRRDPVRKLREFVVARWLEEDLSKRRILEIYLNVIEWGDGIYGCEAAARRWYGKPAASLSVEEAAGLAAMIPNPRRINPRVSPGWHQRATRRVLWLMALSGRIERGEPVPDATPPPVEPPPGESPDIEMDAPPEVLPVIEETPAAPPAGPEASPSAAPQVSEPPAPPAPMPTPTPSPTVDPRQGPA